MNSTEQFLRFLIGGMGGLILAALIFPGQSIPQIASVIIGEALAVLSTRVRKSRSSSIFKE